MLFNISLQALVRVLAEKNVKYIIDIDKKCNNILRFRIAKGYPGAEPFVYSKEFAHELSVSRTAEKPLVGETVLYYDTGTHSIVGCCMGWYTLLNPLRAKRVNNAENPTVT
jgi:hypothetical protein